ncbi:hypothetical protein F8G81_07505 [Arthrobacter sp. CDRTa11]|uniref:hypothetical protein n=1 Tax=Arthrobacter sp. CDRTa11 TaxID=2651199 RepID=UPI002265942E|nr:hypothetical protein [Arthrobacter sp. CDRTa11]UZX02479.1 hypothetical protein F8G81_07505 [Arthrobacter sp. CDRTa11]
MQDHDRVARLVSTALDNFDNPGKSLASLVRQAARIASLRQDFAAQYRFQIELLDVASGAAKTDPTIDGINNNLITLLGVEDARKQVLTAYYGYERGRRMTGTENINVISIAQIEANLAQLHSVYAEYSVTDKGSSYYAHEAAIAADKQQAKLLPMIQAHSEIVEHVRQDVHSYLLLTETNLHSGKPTSSVFERGLEYVRASLAERAPAALEKFSAAEASLAAGTPEDLSHALTSTRRMIKALADALYPATGETIVGVDKVERAMDDEAYRNRLIQFAKEKLGKRLQGKVMGDALASYGKRITNLDSMASKGVHSDVTAAEAEQCVIWSFMLAADLLRIADGTSADLAPVGAPGE